MKRWKDWKPGQYRIKIEIVLADGCSVHYVLPNSEEESVDALIKIASKEFNRDVFEKESDGS
jgi:hypothetical protein